MKKFEKTLKETTLDRPEKHPAGGAAAVLWDGWSRWRRSLAEAVERAGEAIFQEKRVPDVYRKAVGAERENATLVDSEGCVTQNLVAGAGFEPAQGHTDQPDTSSTQARQTPTNSRQTNELQKGEQEPTGQYPDTSGREPDTSQHKKCAISVLRQDEVPTDLAKVVSAWDGLSTDARQRIVEIVEGDQ